MKKVLIILYYFPPAGGPGVQRWLKFIKYLPKYNICPVVIKPKNPSYPIIDDSLLKEVSPELEIHEVPIWEPYSIAHKVNNQNKKYQAGQFDTSKNQSLFSKLSIFIRGNFFIPDARKFWINPCTKYAQNYIRKENIKTVITTGPPHSVHLIGLNLKKEFKDINWIADFRDPWTEISYHKELKLLPFAQKKHKNLEYKVLSSSDLVLATSYTDANRFRELGAKNTITITNGFDSEFNSSKSKNAKFTICYSGVLEQLRNPYPLWESLSELVRENADFRSNFKLKFVGKVDEKIKNELTALNLDSYIQYVGYVSHSKSITEIESADLLLITNFNDKTSKGIIPGKLFEYMATHNTIISIGTEDSDVQKILNKTSAGQHFTYQDKDEIKNFVLNQFSKWKNDEQTVINLDSIKEFHREQLTQRLVEYL
ncbi:MAG: glycosyl transferase family 1 [Flavobacteriales bacterium]|nr:glycosyl transferase family 1 [Flavobacteriales bacterium]